mmetsp:Transcript_6047/g.12449  ORF Transcript_6047/g.12449 Transcript_6047/m.12449 type:complete len:333 (+) Transcript_6047:1932-2930(+)
MVMMTPIPSVLRAVPRNTSPERLTTKETKSPSTVSGPTNAPLPSIHSADNSAPNTKEDPKPGPTWDPAPATSPPLPLPPFLPTPPDVPTPTTPPAPPPTRPEIASPSTETGLTRANPGITGPFATPGRFTLPEARIPIWDGTIWGRVTGPWIRRSHPPSIPWRPRVLRNTAPPRPMGAETRSPRRGSRTCARWTRIRPFAMPDRFTPREGRIRIWDGREWVAVDIRPRHRLRYPLCLRSLHPCRRPLPFLPRRVTRRFLRLLPLWVRPHILPVYPRRIRHFNERGGVGRQRLGGVECMALQLNVLSVILWESMYHTRKQFGSKYHEKLSVTY